jgi:hypothetical protein
MIPDCQTLMCPDLACAAVGEIRIGDAVETTALVDFRTSRLS